ncbi:Predicted Zn-dependent peptidase [Sphingopyxis sp. YR583]|uniref:M16 family metallopeptidase n=1 Tax=Sphingopyxis sp. YR583 TaxID=1881047 RepID=UPI0008A73437|nr:insulinase family protein [Sphingopyxis sp. YR583]SEH12764.1 Predicted Zn-dependent peptidase [Sphingopyxis sp. YR583]
MRILVPACAALYVFASFAQPAWLGAPALAADSGASGELPAEAAGVLPNGFRYYIRQSGLPGAKIESRLIVHVGADNAPVEKAELAHLVEHLSMRSSKKYPDGGLYKQLISHNLTAQYSAFTGPDVTAFNLRTNDGLGTTLDEVLDLLYQATIDMEFTPENFKAELGAVIGENLESLDNSVRRDAVRAIVFDNPQLSNNDHLRLTSALTIDDVRDFHRRWYRPDNMTLLVVCDGNPKVVEARIREIFSRAPAAPTADRIVRTSEGTGQIVPGPGSVAAAVAVRGYDGSELRLISGFSRPAAESDIQGRAREDYLIQLSNAVIASRLARLPLIERGKFDIKDVRFNNYSGLPTDRILALEMKVLPAASTSYSEAMTTMGRFYRQLADFGLGREEFDAARKEAAATLSSPAKANLLSALGQTVIAGDISRLSSVRENSAASAFDGISLDDLNAFVRPRFASAARRLALIGSAPSDADARIALSAFDSAYTRASGPFVAGPGYSSNILTAADVAKIPGRRAISARSISPDVIELRFESGIRVRYISTPNSRISRLYAFRGGGRGGYAEASSRALAGLARYGLNLKLPVAGHPTLAQAVGVTGVSATVKLDDVGASIDLIGSEGLLPVLQTANLMMSPSKSDILQPARTAASRDRGKTLTPSGLAAAKNLPTTSEIYDDRFRNPGDFTFVIAGGLTTSEARRELERYIGSLGSAKSGIAVDSVGEIKLPERPTLNIKTSGFPGVAQHRIWIAGRQPLSREDRLGLELVHRILMIRIPARLRGEETGTYSPTGNLFIFDRPSGISKETPYELHVAFTSLPEDRARLANAAIDEIKQIKSGKVDSVTLKAAFDGLLQTVKARLPRRDRDVEQQIFHLRNGDWPTEPGDAELMEQLGAQGVLARVDRLLRLEDAKQEMVVSE